MARSTCRNDGVSKAVRGPAQREEAHQSILNSKFRSALVAGGSPHSTALTFCSRLRDLSGISASASRAEVAGARVEDEACTRGRGSRSSQKRGMTLPSPVCMSMLRRDEAEGERLRSALLGHRQLRARLLCFRRRPPVDVSLRSRVRLAVC